ncbi:MAG: tRNA pseudouridine(55) synthase TruB [Eggerthellaceae bacterium]|nr:tRNA pseudouridine(55) synthase TruB [Eggerthellaceae bacterium]
MKRGTSGLSLVVAVDKPSGMTSHDVVNRCRRIFEERRVGHTGTLDPLASGVLPVCVGPATRLDRYMTGHDKSYRVTIGFGFETDTDDVEGVPTVRGNVGRDILDGEFAVAYVSGLVGPHMQVPPQYSAIKVNGKKAYELARKGEEAELEPRAIEVYESKLVERFERNGSIFWAVDFSVSKGTYIRALVRDIGRELGCYAHVVALQRRQAGALALEDCVSLDTLEALGTQAAIDPVRLLGFRFAFGDEIEKLVGSGGRFKPEQLSLYGFSQLPRCSCTGSIEESPAALAPDELISVIVANRLKAIYRYDSAANVLRPDCVFSTGVSR